MHFLTLLEANFKTFIEPRLYIDYRFNIHKVYATYSVMHQNDHLVANRSIGNYIKTWIPANEQYLPSKSEELGIGYSFNTNIFALDVELYYKRRNSLIHPKEGDLEFITSDNINNLLNNGAGEAYGIELSVNYQLSDKHRFNGSYSYSKSILSFSELNGNEAFNDYFDRPHTFKLLHSYKINEKWEVNNQFTLLSGTPFTYINNVYPNALFSTRDIGISGGALPKNAIFNFDNLNNKRLPLHHRLDINASKKTKFKKFPATLGFGVYNIYANVNPMFIELEKEFGRNNMINGAQFNNSTTGVNYKIVSYFNFIPYINYTINFK